MERLKIKIDSNTEAIKNTIYQKDETEKNLNLKTKFEDLFYNNSEIKDLEINITLKKMRT